MNRILRAGLLLALWCALPAFGQAQDCDRVVAVGDLHGGVDAFVRILLRTGIIDEDRAWRDERACLVQLGDALDRGPRSPEILDLLIDLKRQAPQRVWPLLGNHETMNLTGDLRYVALGEFAAFAAEEQPADRAAALKQFSDSDKRRSLSAEERRAAFDAVRPPGWFGHRRAYGEEGRYGSWLLGNQGLVIINRSLFVHGGISLPDAARGIEALNRELRAQLLEYNRLRALLIESGWVDPFITARDAVKQLRVRFASAAAANESEATQLIARRFVALYSDALFRASEGPMWNRRLALGDRDTVATELDRLMNSLDVDRIVVAHSTTEDGRIQSRSAGRLYKIDTGAGPAYRGQISALELSRNGFIWAVYAQGADLLVDPRPLDEVLAYRLESGDAIGIEPVVSGGASLRRVLIVHQGRTAPALFKSYQPSRSDDAISKASKRERAAYLLDRRLGLRLVPVMAEREIENQTSLLIGLSGDVIAGSQLDARLPAIPNPGRFAEEQITMQIFDALIGNTARDAGSRLYSGTELTLSLIDHARSFGHQTELPSDFPEVAPVPAGRVITALAALDLEQLQRLLHGLIDEQAMRALLARRDALLSRLRSSS